MDSLRSIASVVVDTPLARHLAGAPPRPSARDAFERARRWFLAGQRIDMQLLADEIGVNRATLYRWVGNRDQFLAELLWSGYLPDRRVAWRTMPGWRVVRVVLSAELLLGHVRRMGVGRWCPSRAWMTVRRSNLDLSPIEPGVQGGLPESTQRPSSLRPWQA